VADAGAGKVVVTLDVAPELQERVVDWLLARSDVATFTSSAVSAYGADSHGFSVAEQVSGRQRRVEVAIELPADAVEGWLRDLATAFVAVDVAYRVTPVLLSGRLHEQAC
jgi:hypothetical protein